MQVNATRRLVGAALLVVVLAATPGCGKRKPKRFKSWRLKGTEILVECLKQNRNPVFRKSRSRN
jgi:hypothetical protein